MSNMIYYRHGKPVAAAPEPKARAKIGSDITIKQVFGAVGFIVVVALASSSYPPSAPTPAPYVHLTPDSPAATAELLNDAVLRGKEARAPEAPKAPELTEAEKNRKAYCEKGEYKPLSIGKDQVRNALRSPSTAEFPSVLWSSEAYRVVFVDVEENDKFGRPAGRCAWAIASYVDAQNVFGALIRHNWFIRVEYEPATDKWFWQDFIIKGKGY